jgi:hypothetical protein
MFPQQTDRPNHVVSFRSLARESVSNAQRYIRNALKSPDLVHISSIYEWVFRVQQNVSNFTVMA